MVGEVQATQQQNIFGQNVRKYLDWEVFTNWRRTDTMIPVGGWLAPGPGQEMAGKWWFHYPTRASDQELSGQSEQNKENIRIQTNFKGELSNLFCGSIHPGYSRWWSSMSWTRERPSGVVGEALEGGRLVDKPGPLSCVQTRQIWRLMNLFLLYSNVVGISRYFHDISLLNYFHFQVCCLTSSAETFCFDVCNFWLARGKMKIFFICESGNFQCSLKLSPNTCD